MFYNARLFRQTARTALVLSKAEMSAAVPMAADSSLVRNTGLSAGVAGSVPSAGPIGNPSREMLGGFLLADFLRPLSVLSLEILGVLAARCARSLVKYSERGRGLEACSVSCNAGLVLCLLAVDA